MAGTQDDKTIGKNLQTLRGDVSQEELASKMRGYGFKWSKATVWSVEQGERPLRLSEAQAVLQCLGNSSMFGLLELSNDNAFAFAEKLRNSISKNIQQIFDLLDEIQDERRNLAGNTDLLINAGSLPAVIASATASELAESLPESIFKQYLVHELHDYDLDAFEYDFTQKYDYETMTVKLQKELFEARSKNAKRTSSLKPTEGQFYDALYDEKQLNRLAQLDNPRHNEDKGK